MTSFNKFSYQLKSRENQEQVKICYLEKPSMLCNSHRGQSARNYHEYWISLHTDWKQKRGDLMSEWSRFVNIKLDHILAGYVKRCLLVNHCTRKVDIPISTENELELYWWNLDHYYHSIASHTSWVAYIFVWVNYNCYLMESHTFWRHKGQHICVSKLPLSLDKLPYQLKTQGQHIWISGLQSWTELLTIWRQKGSIFELINYNDYLMDSLTIWNTRTGYLD